MAFWSPATKRLFMSDGKLKLEDIHIRISVEAKQQIKDYAKSHKITLSDFIRDCCLEQIKNEGKVTK